MLLTIHQQTIEINQPASLETIAKKYFPDQQIYAGIVNGKLYELNHIIENDATIEWVDEQSIIGKQIYERTLTFVFIVATKQLFKDAVIHVEFTFQDGLYCSIQKKESLTPQDVDQIKQRMLDPK